MAHIRCISENLTEGIDWIVKVGYT